MLAELEGDGVVELFGREWGHGDVGGAPAGDGGCGDEAGGVLGVEGARGLGEDFGERVVLVGLAGPGGGDAAGVAAGSPEPDGMAGAVLCPGEGDAGVSGEFGHGWLACGGVCG